MTWRHGGVILRSANSALSKLTDNSESSGKLKIDITQKEKQMP